MHQCTLSDMAAAILCSNSERFAEGNCPKHTGSVKKHKRGRPKFVTWPMDEKLCEVQHFFADDAPSLLGVVAEGFPHSKQQSLLPMYNTPSYEECNYSIGHQLAEAKRARLSSVKKPDGNLVVSPPGCGSSMLKRSPACEVELEALMVIGAPWHCPYKFVLDNAWLWAGGEESSEVALQQQRELRLFEVFYPRLASIPDSPAEPLEKCKQIDDSSVALIPLIPLEEDEGEEMQHPASLKVTESNCTEDVLSECRRMWMHNSPVVESVETKQESLMSEADSKIAAVAAAACMVVKSLGQSDLVDEKLLLEILQNPSMLESLTCSKNVANSKSQVRNNEINTRISQEPIPGLLNKLRPDNAAYLNASPVSVLARWDEGSSCTTPIACGTTDIQEPAIPMTMNLPLTSISTGRDISQKGFEIATRALPERCMNNPMNPPNLQSPSFVHAYKPKDEVRLSCQNGLCDDMHSASCSMQPMPAVKPLIGRSAVSTMLPNNALPCRTSLPGDPHGRFVQGAESKSLQAKKTTLGVLPQTGGRGRTRRLCMYYNSSRGCRNGGSCAFLHQSLDSDLNTAAL